MMHLERSVMRLRVFNKRSVKGRYSVNGMFTITLRFLVPLAVVPFIINDTNDIACFPKKKKHLHVLWASKIFLFYFI